MSNYFTTYNFFSVSSAIAKLAHFIHPRHGLARWSDMLISDTLFDTINRAVIGGCCPLALVMTDQEILDFTIKYQKQLAREELPGQNESDLAVKVISKLSSWLPLHLNSLTEYKAVPLHKLVYLHRAHRPDGRAPEMQTSPMLTVEGTAVAPVTIVQLDKVTSTARDRLMADIRARIMGLFKDKKTVFPLLAHGYARGVFYDADGKVDSRLDTVDYIEAIAVSSSDLDPMEKVERMLRPRKDDKWEVIPFIFFTIFIIF